MAESQFANTPGLSFNWALESCPSIKWCAGINQGQNEPTPQEARTPALITSGNDGNTWSDRPLPSALVPKGDLLSQSVLSCPTVGYCVLAGTLVYGSTSPTLRAAKHNGQSFVAVTDDFGGHWTRSVLPRQTTAIMSIDCADSLHCLATATAGTSPESRYAEYPEDPSELLQSDDGGLSWSALHTDLPWDNMDISDLICASVSQCLVEGFPADLRTSGTTMFRTTDFGSTWHSVALPRESPGNALSLYRPACATQSFCVMTGVAGMPSDTNSGNGEPVMLTTHDGGATWSQQKIPVPIQLP